MPRQDGTGPQGRGALIGRGLGPCKNGIRREICGRELGKGFGFRARYSTPLTLTKDEEKKILEADLQDIESEKEAIQKRIKEIN